jgi:hypothetical protein
MGGETLSVPTAPAAILLAAFLGTGAGPSGPPPVRVPTERILQAMREAKSYSLTATANGARLEADVVLSIVHEAAATDPERRPLFFGHQEWYDAFLARTGLTPAQAPVYVRLSYRIGQDMIVDYRREDVIEAVLEGPDPRVAANVWIFWKGGPGELSYEDRASRPNLLVTEKRLITYRLVEYADLIWYAQVSGLYGRPTSGALGALFSVIGQARVRDTRSVFLPDGFQVVRSQASKWWMRRTATATVWPDGHAQEKIPPGRPDLVAVAARLGEPLAIRFRPMPPPPG